MPPDSELVMQAFRFTLAMLSFLASFGEAQTGALLQEGAGGCEAAVGLYQQGGGFTNFFCAVLVLAAPCSLSLQRRQRL